MYAFSLPIHYFINYFSSCSIDFFNSSGKEVLKVLTSCAYFPYLSIKGIRSLSLAQILFCSLNGGNGIHKLSKLSELRVFYRIYRIAEHHKTNPHCGYTQRCCRRVYNRAIHGIKKSKVLPLLVHKNYMIKQKECS